MVSVGPLFQLQVSYDSFLFPRQIIDVYLVPGSSILHVSLEEDMKLFLTCVILSRLINELGCKRGQNSVYAFHLIGFWDISAL